jgi:hypothetical protein
LRMRFAPSISIELAMSSSSLTCLVLSSERCMANAGTADNGRNGREAAGRKRVGKLKRAAEGRRGARSSAGRLPAGGRRGVGRAPAQVERRVAGLEIAVKESGQLRLGQRADLLGMDLAALVQDDRRDAADAVLAGRRRVGVDVELGDRQLVLVGPWRRRRAPARTSCTARTIRPRNRRARAWDWSTSLSKLESETCLIRSFMWISSVAYQG